MNAFASEQKRRCKWIHYTLKPIQWTRATVNIETRIHIQAINTQEYPERDPELDNCSIQLQNVTDRQKFADTIECLALLPALKIAQVAPSSHHQKSNVLQNQNQELTPKIKTQCSHQKSQPNQKPKSFCLAPKIKTRSQDQKLKPQPAQNHKWIGTPWTRKLHQSATTSMI